MNWKILVLILTLVGCFSNSGWSTPNQHAPPSEQDSDSQTKGEDSSLEGFSLSPTPEFSIEKTRRIRRIFPYTQSLSFNVGAGFDPSPRNNYGIYKFTYANTWRRFHGLEVSLGVIELESGIAQLSYKQNYRGLFYFRPTTKLGLTYRAKSDENLAGFLVYKNYFLTAGAGLEWNSFESLGFRLDIEASASTERTFFAATAGLLASW